MVTLYGPDDAALTDASIRFQDDSGAMVLADVARPDALLQYYFGRGGSEIRVDLDGRPLRGRLATRWLGSGRAWFIRPEAQAPSTTSGGSAQTGGVSSATGRPRGRADQAGTAKARPRRRAARAS